MTFQRILTGRIDYGINKESCSQVYKIENRNTAAKKKE